MRRIKSTVTGSILLEKRNLNIHRQSVEIIPFLKFMFGGVFTEEEFEKISEQQKEAFRLSNPTRPPTVFYTPKFAHVGVQAFSEEILSIMKDLVSKAHAKFPNEMSDVKF